MTAETLFLTIFVRHQSDFEEVRELYEQDPDGLGVVAVDRLCERLRLRGPVEELAVMYLHGEYEPLD